MTAKRIRLIITAAIVAAILLAAFVITYEPPKLRPSEEDVVRSQWVNVANVLYDGGRAFYYNVHADFVENSNGSVRLEVTIDPELDGLLELLAEAYNADPSTNAPVTADELRYDLTDNIIEATGRDPNSPFRSFLVWCGSPADLVYGVDVYTSDGENCLAGDAVVDSPTNYEFISSRETLFKHYIYSWEYSEQ